ncbi:HAD family hydrolase [uncultured Vagococcus sp.]|uniref:HAD family hydrolase n=1 Tax=uncultured Vagococcus sp. TaxID=189676 RepID=UPI0028D8BE81|nr:HAD family hydrolase [uncultured Vagococcus sp.]
MKLLATDFDGTLFIDNEIPTETLLQIKNWQLAGNVFGIITGRDEIMIVDKLKDYDLDIDFFIGNNGAVVDGRLDNPIHMEDILELLTEKLTFQSEHILLFKEKEHLVLLNKKSSKFYYREYDQLKKITRKQLESITSVTQLSFQFTTNYEARLCGKQINQLEGRRLQAFQNNNCVDIVSRGTNKAVGLSRYMSSQNCEFEEVVVIGDGENDKELIKTFNGYSLPHASPSVRQLANGIVGSVGELISSLMR